jgi:hypothetical protein
MAVSLKLRKLWVKKEHLKFCENEPSTAPNFFEFLKKCVDIIQNPLDFLVVKVWIGLLSGVTLTPLTKNLVEVRNSKVLQIFVSLCFV